MCAFCHQHELAHARPRLTAWLKRGEPQASHRLGASCYASFGFQGETLRVFDFLGREVNVQVWPVVMAGRWFLDIDDLCQRHFLEPGEIVVG